MAEGQDFQQPYNPIDDPMRPEYYQARRLPIPSWLAAQLGLNQPAPVAPAPAPAPAPRPTPTPDQLKTLLTNPTTAPQPDEKPTLDPIALAQQNQLITDTVQQARKLPGGAPTTAVLPGGTPINIQNFQPIDRATLDPVAQKFLDLANQNFNALPKVDLQQLQLPGKGFTLSGSATPEEAELEQAFLRGDQLFPAQLSRLANLRMGRYKLPEEAPWQKALRLLDLTGIGVGLGLASGGSLGGVVGPAIGGAVSGASTSALTGGLKRPNDLWKNALIGGAGGAVGGATAPYTSSLGPIAGGAAQAGIRGGTGAIANWVLKGGNLTDVPLSVATGAAGGAVSGALGGGALGSAAQGLTSGGLRNLIQNTTGWGAPQAQGPDLASALRDQQNYQTQLGREQDDWKQRYATALADRQQQFADAVAAQQEAIDAKRRELYDAFEQKRGEQVRQQAEYQRQLRAMIDQQMASLTTALEQMGLSEGGAGSLVNQFRQAQDAERAKQEAEAEQARQQTIASRQFFPSALLETSPGTQDFATSSVLVPHSPPPVQFGSGEFPASYSQYAQAEPPTFSAEGFLPSGLGATQSPGLATPPVASPLGARRYPTLTLLNGLTRSPYLMGVA